MQRKPLLRLLKEIQFHTPFRRYGLPRYLYCFTAPQLCFLCQCLHELRNCEGAIAEVGCAKGWTTVFLNKYMDADRIDKRYYAVDTFSGFVADDIDYEVSKRGKSRDFFSGFQVNKKKWFDAAMQQNGISRVQSIEADVNKFDLSRLAPLSFVLLDVDLYRPMVKGLRELYAGLSPGGMIVVDDCNPRNVRWDGSDQAYKEFMAERDLQPRIVHEKLGIVQKPASAGRFYGA